MSSSGAGYSPPDYSLSSHKKLFGFLLTLPENERKAMMDKFLGGGVRAEYELYKIENGLMTNIDESFRSVIFSDDDYDEIDDYYVTAGVIALYIAVRDGITTLDHVCELLTKRLANSKLESAFRLLFSEYRVDEMVTELSLMWGCKIGHILPCAYMANKNRFELLIKSLLVTFSPEKLFQHICVNSGMYYTQWQLEMEREVIRASVKRLEDYEIRPDRPSAWSAKDRIKYLTSIDQV